MRSRRSRVAWVLAAWTALALTSSASQVPTTPSTQSLAFRVIVVESSDEAERILARVRDGEDFAGLARRVSLDPSAGNGGFIAPSAVPGLRPELRQAAEGLRLGQVSAAIRVPTGFALLKAVPPDPVETGGQVSLALAAAGAMRYVADVSGYTEAILALKLHAKPSDWNQQLLTSCEMRRQALVDTKASVSAYLKSVESGHGIQPVDLIQAYFVMGQLHSYDGDMAAALEAFERGYAVASSRYPAGRHDLDEVLGVAYLHKAEMDNGLYRVPGDRCLLSDSPNRKLANTSAAEHAVEHLTRFLTEKPDDLEVRWLLNLAHMARGTYPTKVPQGQLIEMSSFASAEHVGRFTDVASEAGLSAVSSAGGVIVDDFDNNGSLDVVTTDFNPCQPMRLFRRKQGGPFVNEAARAGLGDQLGGLNAVQADFDNDGYLDILVLRGAWETPQRMSLLRNNRNGTFTDVTVASGLAQPIRTQAAAWADINRDGWLDLFIGDEDGPSHLFLNRGNGTFEDVSARARVNKSAYTKGVSAGDYDNDGWPDFFVSNLGGTSFLYHNNHDGTFTERAEAAGVVGSGAGFATWFFDYDNDGWQDIFETSYITSVDETIRTYLKLPHNANTLKLYRNLGNGTFQDVTRQVGLDKVFMPMGANFGDIDNDGFPDIYLGTGHPSYAALVPSVLLRNRNGSSFVDVTASSGTGELHKGHGVAFADLDRDGDEEIVFEVGGGTPGDAHPLRLFENPGNANNWITLQLRGVKTNRAAIGARIAVTVENSGLGTRTIHRMVSSGGSFGASPLQQHIGLGPRARILALDIWWPTSDTHQHFTNVSTNEFLAVTELANDLVRLERPRSPLHGE